MRVAEKLVSELHEGRLEHVLDEVVGHVVSCWDVFQLQFRCFDEVPDEMMPRLDELGPIVGDWGIGQGDCTLIVTVDKSSDHRRVEQEMKVSSPCMKMASCAAKAEATYSASQELSAT